MNDLFADMMKNLSDKVSDEYAQEVQRRLEASDPVVLELIRLSQSYAELAIATNNQRFMDIAMGFFASTDILPEMFPSTHSILAGSDSLWSTSIDVLRSATDPSQFLP
jgi:hypothetical protein